MDVIIGVDEAGRGALAGPVAAAAVVLHPDNVPVGITDSKQLTAAQRTILAEQIQASALAYSVALVHHERIDEVNILQATFDAMHQAVDAVLTRLEGKGLVATHLRVDGNRFRPHAIPHTCLVKGDATDRSIGAASILAKTARDLWMVEQAESRFPHYGFAAHKGYGTAQHRSALLTYGPCEIHRHTFLSKILGTSARA